MAVTPNYNFELIDFDTIPWHEKEHNNWRIIDSVFSNFIVVSNLKGVWLNALSVTVGEKYVDAELGTIFEVLEAHTTPSTGLFAAARTAIPARWQAFTVQVTAKGSYTQNTVYSPNDFVSESSRFGVVQNAYTSDNTTGNTTTQSYDADVTAGNISTLVDVSGSVDAAAASATAAAASAASVSLPTIVADNFLQANAGATAYVAQTAAQVFASIKSAASATVTGVVELATDDETIEGTDTARAVTPANIQAKVASATASGIVELATTPETVTGTDTARVVTPAGLRGAFIGQQTLWVPAAAMEARVSTEPATSNAVEIGTSYFAARTMDFKDAADTHCHFGIQMPKAWDVSEPLVLQFVWSATGTAGNTVLWGAAATCLDNDEVLTTAFPALATVADTNSTTADDLMISPEVSVVVGSSPTKESYVMFQISRDVSGDSLTQDARLHGVKIHYTVDSGIDD